jgi:hypothetical protein
MNTVDKPVENHRDPQRDPQPSQTTTAVTTPVTTCMTLITLGVTGGHAPRNQAVTQRVTPPPKGGRRRVAANHRTTNQHTATRPRDVARTIKRKGHDGSLLALETLAELAGCHGHQPHGCVSQSRMVGGSGGWISARPHGCAGGRQHLLVAGDAAGWLTPTRQFAQPALAAIAAPACLSPVDKRSWVACGESKKGVA